MSSAVSRKPQFCHLAQKGNTLAAVSKTLPRQAFYRGSPAAPAARELTKGAKNGC
jgi:hypothetical protein